MARVNIVLLPKKEMYPVRVILEELKEEDIRKTKLFVSKEVYKRILRSLLKQMGNDLKCAYGDLCVPMGYSITLTKTDIENVYAIHWLTHGDEYVYVGTNVPENSKQFFFHVEGEEVTKELRALSQMSPEP